MSKKLERLRARADACHESCSDYSCVRRGDCGGFAGHEYRAECHRLEEKRKQAESDAALAAQIKRLKKAGAI